MAKKGLINPKMKDEQRGLKKAFNKTAQGVIPQGKNYYSLSMQEYITNMDDQQLENVCDNFVDNWINAEKDKVMGKYNVSSKINKRNSIKPDKNTSLRLKTEKSATARKEGRDAGLNVSHQTSMSENEWKQSMIKKDKK